MSFLKLNPAPKYYGDYCNSSLDCSQADYLICSNNKCTCSSSAYFTGTTCGNKP